MHTKLKNMIWIMPAIVLVCVLQGRGAAPHPPSARAAPGFPPLAALVHVALPPPRLAAAG